MTRSTAFFCLTIVALPFDWSRAQSEAPSASIARLERQPADSPLRIELLKVQIALDKAGFRPGKLDGLGGEFTQAAADRYNQANSIEPGARIDVSTVVEPTRDYTFTEDDLKWVGKLASSPAEQEKLERMPYADPWELVAEKFHCDLNYLHELNPTLPTPVVGTVFRVPNVDEFSMQAVLALNTERKAKAKAEKEATPTPSPSPSSSPVNTPQPLDPSIQPDVPPPSPTPSPKPSPTPEPERHLVILRGPRIIELYENDKIIASFPCTPGSDRVPVPVGMWQVTSNILMPYFRYDKSVLKDGTRSDNAFNIPPGPNNYVGIVWMGINRKSVGIHGTNSPDQIGRNQSSGCIRMANWDAFYLTQKINPGTRVEVR